MSSFTKTVCARDLLGWAISQGTFTEDGIRQRDPHRRVTAGVEGPWTEILEALITITGEGLADPSSGIARDGWLEGFEEYVEARCLTNLVEAFSLTADQAGIVMRLATEIRLFFDGAITIAPTGLDGPICGDLRYHCSFDYEIEVPSWARWALG